MISDFENPFANFGGIVSGTRFIGRKIGLQAIVSRLIKPHKSGSLAIIGVTRIGKSSLVYQALMERREELISKRILPIWINLATYRRAELFFQSLVHLCQEHLKEQGWLTEPIRVAASYIPQEEFSWDTDYRNIQYFFKKIREDPSGADSCYFYPR